MERGSSSSGTAELLSSKDNSTSDFVATTQGRLQSDEVTTVRIYKDNAPSVVYITCHHVEQATLTQGTGSGCVWDKQGLIVTNYHVIDGAFDLRVTFANKSPYDARVVWIDKENDIAVLQIVAPKEELRPISIGVSKGLDVGQKVYVIGHPFGLGHSLTTGVISGLHRTIRCDDTGRTIHDVIQTDAAINPGNSGGPLFDSSGFCIGLITAICSPSRASCGIAFAIPVDTVAGILKKVTTPKPLVEYGKVTTASLEIQFAPDQSVEQLVVSGVLIEDAPANGPAGKAVGLRSSGPRNASHEMKPLRLSVGFRSSRLRNASSKCASLKRRTSHLQSRQIKDRIRSLRKDFAEIVDAQRSIGEGQRKVRERFGEMQSENEKLKQETYLITKDSSSIQIRLNLMYQIIKARAQNDSALVAQLSRLLRMGVGHTSRVACKGVFMAMVC